jgi:hypothetical protein
LAYTQNQPTTQSVLQRFLKQITENPVEMAFTFTYENTAKKLQDEMKGILRYSGNSFHLQLDDMDVYCDGKSKWVCMNGIKEVTIYRADESPDLMDNPLQFILANKDKFRYKPLRNTTHKGQKILRIEMIPVDTNTAYTSVVLLLHDETLNPVQFIYNMKNTQRYVIDIDKIAKTTAVPDNFIFPTALYHDFNIVDLRE